MIFKIFGTSLLLSMITGCLSYPSIEYRCENKTETYEVENGWQPNEVLYIERSVGSRYCSHYYEYRGGRTNTGFNYKITSNNSASIGNWDISCKTDTMTDERICSVYSIENKLFIYIKKSNILNICIIGHDFPYRNGAIRIDKNKPVVTDFDGCIEGNNINKLYSANNISLRYYKWPDDYAKDHVRSISGLKEAIELARFISKNADKITFRKISSKQ